MKFLAHPLQMFTALVGLHLAVKNRFIDEYWQRSVQLGSFENAWEAINKEGVYYLMLGTSHRPYDCVALNVTETFPGVNVIHYEVYMYNASLRITEKYNGSAIVLRDVRGIQSTIEWIRKDMRRIRKSQVLYTEKKNKCFVLYYPDTSDYELWANTNETNFIPRCCEFAFTFVTYELETYLNFNHAICKNVV
ncbi:male-specific histamine-binding salivary protein-like [Ixodes scapularis]|uniref:male-specific histamine-binding salivary protein-like n=1 Tax=Ixodes scapularis TaxID=6945 RepID=UPI001C38BF3D|nr:male-specific histamine-binding salivary protein-like [Ixodes scapularis]